ncbi:hypothetical protein VOLCADRAFT_103860 [Volvox carteri f. nagariensis]|uniref:Uncharacterized protein n=1 Tax=Volvox carteri f. nagariensis TaxID=3068 RepID=D8TPQ1_VOLCA|nr:uncharacterized protein VOLCADRAFT_103860 [Volvox carteri f. nagariensis]EFJ50653.1 hypothetical protein VOLCADRAFT_103860 [Volvox carteri f. nagariensis]|eukprot:XP_002948246.1 hypothetical protein VOLCADRAFT_103860 [Volvox carteri f. nagariensis]
MAGYALGLTRPLLNRHTYPNSSISCDAVTSVVIASANTGASVRFHEAENLGRPASPYLLSHKGTTAPPLSLRLQPAAVVANCCKSVEVDCMYGIPGYDTLTNFDHNGDDLIQIQDPFEAIASCNADPACKGFNSEGWLKTFVIPAKFKADVCLYVKILPPPSPRPPPRASSPPPLPPTVCQNFAGFTVKADVDHSADDLRFFSNLNDAVAFCRNNSLCKGFNSDGYTKTLAPACT